MPIVNIPGVGSGKLKLTGAMLAKIYIGKIKTWNDSRHQGAQPRREAARPQDRRRAPLRRVGHDLDLHPLPDRRERHVGEQGRRRHDRQWPVGIGGKGSDDVAANVKQAKGRIGYVEYAYAVQARIP